jgi:hypothetical protein
MDPDACLRRILHAMMDNDRIEAATALADLAHWLAIGGSMPLATQLQQSMVRDLLERMQP